MKSKFLSLFIISALSISLLVGCGNNEKDTNGTPSQQEQTDNSNKDDSATTPKDDDSSKEDTEKNAEEKVQSKFEEAINKIYNTDYTNEDTAMEAETYIKANFTPEGAEDMINKIIGYQSEVTSSDLLVTLVKNVPNTDSRYESMYEIRYNVTIGFDKPSAYSDINAVAFLDKDGNVKIESINENNF